MTIKNTEQKYGLVTILFHWTIAILVIGMISVGLYMSDLPVSPLKLKLYRWHKETGVVILGLVFLRLLWRMQNILPLHSLLVPRWQVVAARSLHITLYVFLILMPLTGWFGSSAGGYSVSFFGWFLMPNLVPESKALSSVLFEAHEVFGYIIIGLICVHVAAIFQHLIMYRENILKRMLP